MTYDPSRLYFCDVRHVRVRPKRHRLRYFVPYLLLDLDRADDLSRRLRYFSYNRANLVSFYDEDHGKGLRAPGESLKQWIVREMAEAAGAARAACIDRVYLFCIPRMFGYCFNPISVYFCHDKQGRCVAIVYEVNNTFGEKQLYRFATNGEEGRTFVHSCDKALYVSPFNGCDGHYDFKVTEPGDAFRLSINYRDADGLLLNASLNGHRQDLSDCTLVKALIKFPLAAFGVVAGIHFEAVILWLKGVPFVSRKTAGAKS